MQWPLTNAIWLADTIPPSLQASWWAIILLTSLAKLWMRLTGRKSLTSTTSSFLGNRVRIAVLIKEFQVYKISTLHRCKGCHQIWLDGRATHFIESISVTPSGPSALSEGSRLIVFHTSSSLKVHVAEAPNYPSWYISLSVHKYPGVCHRMRKFQQLFPHG